jgi:hypothetical protein
MTFWASVLVSLLANVFAGLLFVSLYIVIQWFLAATDVTVSYNWRFDGSQGSPSNIRPSFDIRNRSRSRTYFLGNVAYLRDNRPAAPFDNTSVWGRELKPGSIQFLEAAPIASLTSLAQCTETEVHVRLQNGRKFWLRGTGPSQLRIGPVQRAAFWLRGKFEATAIPLD